MTTLFRNILVPYDFSLHSTRALRVAADLAATHRGRICVVHVVPMLSQFVGIPSGGFPPAVVTAELVRDQKRRLEAHVARTVRKRTRVECQVVIGDPVRAIIQAARGRTAIVMSTLGLTGVSRFVIGSVAERVVRHAPIPVLTLRAGTRMLARAVRARRRAAA